MTSIAALRNLQPGWDGPGSQPIPDQSFDLFDQFLEKVPPERIWDAEPLGTYEGSLRMEWESGTRAYVAEIEADGGLYLCSLDDDEDNDFDRTLEVFDLDTLVEFFLTGRLPSKV